MIKTINLSKTKKNSVEKKKKIVGKVFFLLKWRKNRLQQLVI